MIGFAAMLEYSGTRRWLPPHDYFAIAAIAAILSRANYADARDDIAATRRRFRDEGRDAAAPRRSPSMRHFADIGIAHGRSVARLVTC